MQSEESLREAVCEAGRRMWQRNLAAATDGNISVRVSESTFLCTPSGVSKGFMAPGDLLIADASGKRLCGNGTVTSEFHTHLAVYEERQDVRAVVHAHPPKAVAASLIGLSLEEPVLPEVLLTVGGIPTVPYATPATEEGGEAIRSIIARCDAVLIARHGSITVGHDVFDAYHKLEKLEHAAETLLWANMLGRPSHLSETQVAKLHQIQQAYCPSTRCFKENG